MKEENDASPFFACLYKTVEAHVTVGDIVSSSRCFYSHRKELNPPIYVKVSKCFKIVESMKLFLF